MAEKSYGQVAFEAYTENRGGKNWDGTPTPPWEKLGDGVRAGWDAAGNAAASKMGKEILKDLAKDAPPGVVT